MRLIAVLVGWCALFACNSSPTMSSEPLDLSADLDLPLPERNLLPKAETTGEQRQTKSDEFDVRGDFADIFGESAPPNGPVRAIAEFENTEAVLVAWEIELGTFLLNLIDTVSVASDVWVLTWDLEQTQVVRELLEIRGTDQSRVKFFEFPHESFWTRDYGPISVVDEGGVTSFIDPRYYPQRRRDDAVPTLMSRYFGVDVSRPPLSTEGGNFMTNGEGICVVTNWLLEENPAMTPERLQDIQDGYFGCRRTVVLERLAREGTGHVDMFAKFLSPDTILVGAYDELDPENAVLLDRNVDRLRDFAQRIGWILNIVRIPMPVGANGVYRSYTNSLIVNDLVIVPTYSADRRYEAEALEIYQNALPAGYRVIALDAEDAIQLGGAVHCTTMGFVTAELPPESIPALPETTVEAPSPTDTAESAATSSPDLPIEDEATLVDVIEISSQGLASTVRLDVWIEHSYLGDLVVELEHNDVRFSVLRNVGTGAQRLKRSFEFQVPQGIERFGVWRLVVRDTAPRDVGTLRGWSLAFEN